VISCTNDGTIDSKVIGFTSCTTSNDESGVDTKSGHVTIPEDGYYELSFSGALKTFAGKRIWVTLGKKSVDSKGEIVF
jgi:hypothetical protein